MAAPFNEFQFVNSNLVNLSNNNVNVPHTGRVPLPNATVTSFYATETFLNSTTGQTEVSVGLVQN